MKALAKLRRFAGAFVFLAVLAAAGAGTARAQEAVCASEGSAGKLACAILKARAQGLARDRAWLTLLHYHASAFGGWKSNAAGGDFFLSGDRGRTDPEAELVATLTALYETPAERAELSQPQCVFPARTAWLRERLGLDQRALPARPCPLYDGWRAGISANAVTLVYASAYLNSPASMYGHTFMRLSRATGEGNPLLDYIINFAADVDTKSGLVYAWKGVTGGFEGRFYIMPYYFKVQEYSNLESRDLWEYELALTPAQIERLVQHAWETRSGHFSYFFFTRNCSFYLLELLEAAAPELHLSEQFGTHVIPADTVRVVLAVPGLVTHRAPRPSILASMRKRKALLEGDELASAERWAKLPAPEATPPRGQRPALREALMLDAAYDYFRFREGLKKEPTDEFKLRERKLLLARGRTGTPPVAVKVRPEADAPERGHETMRVSLGGGASNASGAFQRLTFRGALHDFLDPAPGYPHDATLVMFGLALRFDDPSRRLRVDRVDALEIISALPYDRWVHGGSWKVWVGADNARELGCDAPAQNPNGWSCLYGGATTGGGLAARFGADRRGLAFLLAETDFGAGPAFGSSKVRAGIGAEAGVAAQVTSFWSWQVGGRYIYYPWPDQRGRLRASLTQAFLVSNRVALRLGIATAGPYAEGWGELFLYL